MGEAGLDSWFFLGFSGLFGKNRAYPFYEWDRGRKRLRFDMVYFMMQKEGQQPKKH